jgi:hypothetical protein
MGDCLQESLKFTSLSRTETVSNWLENFASFSLDKGEIFDSYSLTKLAEWQQLMRRLMVKTNGFVKK